MKPMKNFERGFFRLQRAVEGIPDRVPFTSQMHEFAMVWSGISGNKFYTNADVFVSGILKTAKDFDFDIPSLGYDAYNIEAEALGQELTFLEGQAPAANNTLPLISEKKDLLYLKPPVTGSAGRMPFVLDVYRIYREQTGISPALQFCAPFSLAVLLRGYTNFMQDLYSDKDFAHNLLNFLTEEVIAPWINVQKEEFPESISAQGADALCSLPMVNMEIIQSYSIPYIHRLRELCGVEISVTNWWGESCANNIDEFLELKLKVASGLIRVQDPDVAKVGPRVIKAFAVKHNLVLELGLGDVILCQGNKEKIVERIRNYIGQAAEGGRFILYFCSLNADTPPENVRTAVAAVKEYGEYEIQH